MDGWVGGWFCKEILPLRGPSCKLRLARILTELNLQDGPSVAISKTWPCTVNIHSIEYSIGDRGLFLKSILQNPIKLL